MRHRTTLPFQALTLSRDGDEPLHRQLYEQLRQAVLSGQLAPGRRIPSSRALASDLGCARNTVINAYEQLFSEGYLETRHGSGSYVSSVLPEDLLPKRRPRPDPDPAPRGNDLTLSARGRRIAAIRPEPRSQSLAFAVGVPDLTAFPFALWTRLLGRFWRAPQSDLLHHGDPAGYAPLRRAIADYLNTVRGLGCSAAQVLITNGSQQAVDLVARVLLDPGDRVWVEDPGYPGLRGPLRAAGAEIVPVPVDRHGLIVSAGLTAAPKARLAVVAPSHQYPLGHTLSLSRRLALLDWVYEQKSWILEDDYDSEYRYAGRPLAALRGLDGQRPDGGGRVIYLGSFSKVMFPSLRLGYLVVPEDLAEDFVAARAALEGHPSVVAQPALARFFEEGHFAAHIRRMRLLYEGRQKALLAAAESHLADHLALQADEAGMHLVADLKQASGRRAEDRAVAARAARAGVTVAPLSSYYLGPAERQGLLLGYAAVPEAQIDEAARRLASVVV